jgi:hypothetical protein
MKVIIAWLMAFLCGIAVDMITSTVFVLAFPDVIDTAQGMTLANAIIVAVIIVFVLPMTFGINRLTFKRLRDEEIYVTNIFAVYKNLPRTWLVMLVQILPAGVATAVIMGTVQLWKLISSFTLIKYRLWASIPVYAVVILMAIALLVLTALLWTRMLLLPAYAFRGDMSLWRAFACSAQASRGRTKQMFGLFASYLG